MIDHKVEKILVISTPIPIHFKNFFRECFAFLILISLKPIRIMYASGIWARFKVTKFPKSLSLEGL